MNQPGARPESPEALIKSAYRLYQLNRIEEALELARHAVSSAPGDPSCLNARGMILGALGRDPEALADFERAVAIQPDFADAINNRGTVFARQGRFEQALACYEQSLALAPNQTHVRYNSSTARLALGDWQRGFRDFESRWALFPAEARRFQRLAPLWLGETPIAGKTVLLHHEQGFGDALQFSRYAPLLAERGARVIVAVPQALQALMRTLPGAPRIVGEGEEIPAHDCCCGLMSLPLAFGTTPETVPARIPYLRADTRRVEAWRGRLGESTAPRIGLVWTGRRYPPINHPRDMSLDLIRPLLGVQAHFVCLQPELSVGERQLLATLPNVSLLGEGLKDFADTAALIEHLDLVISVDTAVAHLAGALGKQVWVMNRFASCWRWLQTRSDSPWYPTLRLFRQHSLGDWTPVVAQVRQAALEFVAAFQRPRRKNSRAEDRPAAAICAELVALLNGALTKYRQGRLDPAIDAYHSILKAHPGQPEAQHYLGVALAQSGRFEEALTFLSAALSAQPSNPSLHIHHGNALIGLGRLEDALASYDQAIALDPSSAEAHYHRATAAVALDRQDDAIQSYRRSIALRPQYAQAHNNLGNVLLELGRLEEAEQSYRHSIHADPSFIDAWINCAHAQRRLHHYEDALINSDRAIGIASQYAPGYAARGAILACLGRYEEALSSYSRALELQPDLIDASWNKAIAHLSRGELREGWRLYEARWQVKSLGLKQHYPNQPHWRGQETLQGKRILLHAEQGYGDTLQFCRYASMVAALGAHVLLGVPSALKALMSTVKGVAEVVSRGSLPPVDYHCPLLSLPLAFETDLSTIPAKVPYLTADPLLRERWKATLGTDSHLRVGIAWSGKPSHTNDANRSIGLEALLPLGELPAQFVSLQNEVRASDMQTLENAGWLRRLGERVTDFADTAALVSEMDLVVTVDTAVAHLAGALGKPVWILLPRVADWRWLQGREDSPWYPTARLYRQATAGDWGRVIERVSGDLSRWLMEHPSCIDSARSLHT